MKMGVFMKNKIIFMILVLVAITMGHQTIMGTSVIAIKRGGSSLGISGGDLRGIGKGYSRGYIGSKNVFDSFFDSDSDSGNNSDSEVAYLSESSGSDSDDEILGADDKADAARKAVLWNHDQELRLLLKNGALVKFDKEEALRNAAAYGYPSIVKVLLDAGALVNAQDSKGATALMYAAVTPQQKNTAFKGNHEAAIEVLLMNGAGFDQRNKYYSNVDIQDMYGDTALIKAVRADNADRVRMLTLAGADSELENLADESALSLASYGIKQVIQNAMQEKQAFEHVDLLSSKIADEWHLLPKDLANIVTESASNPYGPQAIALKAALLVQQKSDEEDAQSQLEAIKRLSLDDAFVSQEGIREVLD